MSSRRPHRKSRRGCTECKRRHIKCDEAKPVCGNCSITRRDCSFLSTTASIFERLGFDRGHSSLRSSPTPSLSNSCDTSSPSSKPGNQQSSLETQDDTTPTSDVFDVPPANLAQLELLHHFAQGSLEFPVSLMGSDEVTPSRIIEQALTCDYLMNEILAFSARHLAIVKPEKSTFYLDQAEQYQTYALASFNRQKAHEMPEERMRVVLFSWILGIHLLCDVAPLGHEEGTLERFLHYLQIYGGVRAATSCAWEELLETDHRDVLQNSVALAKRLCTGGRTSSLRLLILESIGMEETEKQQSEEALASLQQVFEEYEKNGLEGALPDCFLMAFLWPLMINQAFIGLLQKRRPEALLVLAHFAVLLHWCRQHWIFARVGASLLNSIALELGQGWERWLQWPKQMVGRHD
ncbi:Zn(2)-C6 fungal-type domain-containing protein [Fusarium sp. Ph1]|nr:Zn(2)-C6 fungal-type domain-containing protein [Fusarium sp. Ph1]